MAFRSHLGSAQLIVKAQSLSLMFSSGHLQGLTYKINWHSSPQKYITINVLMIKSLYIFSPVVIKGVPMESTKALDQSIKHLVI